MAITYDFDIARLAEVVKITSLIGITISISYLLLSYAHNVFFHPLRSYPGPKTWAASNLPFAKGLLKGTCTKQIVALHEKYDSLVIRTGPDRLSYIDASAFKDIYGHRQGKLNMDKDGKFYAKPPLEAWSLLNAEDEDHGRMRRNISHAFSAKALEEQQDMLQGYIDLLVKRLKERSGQVVDLVNWYNFTTFDIIGDLAFGEPFGCLEKGELHPWIHTIFVSLQAHATIHAAKQFDWILPILMRCIPASIDKKRIEHYEFGNSKAERRIAKGFDTDRKDFLTYILKYNDTKYGLSEAEMKSNAGLFVFAGSETTATLLSGTTYYLLRNPEKMEKLVKEVRGAFKSEKDINFQSVSELKYLVACLEEGLRIYPPVPTGLPRKVPKGGDTIAGKFVPEGTAVSVTHLGTFHQASNFQDPKSYVPERWTGEDPKYDSDNKSAVQPFSLGPRNCIGQHLAIVEMRLILARVLWNFDLEIQDKSEDWTDQPIMIIWHKRPLMVRVTGRKM